MIKDKCENKSASGKLTVVLCVCVHERMCARKMHPLVSLKFQFLYSHDVSSCFVFFSLFALYLLELLLSQKCFQELYHEKMN